MIKNKVFYKTVNKSLQNLQDKELERIRYQDAQAHASVAIFDPFRVIKMEPRSRGCNLKARKTCQKIAEGERSVPPGSAIPLMDSSGTGDRVERRPRMENI